MTIKPECADIGKKLLYAREYLQTALDMAAHAKRPEDLVSAGLAKDIITECKKLYREVDTGHEGIWVDAAITTALQKLNMADYDSAITFMLQARSGILDLMFQTVVACECRER